MYENDITYVDLLARSWVEIYSPDYLNGLNTSTSLRGRELKYCPNDEAVRARIVDLLARSWVEIQFKLTRSQSKAGRPPCEVVSWNIIDYGIELLAGNGRPPCEVVSWNMQRISNKMTGSVDLLARSWVEIQNPVPIWVLVPGRPPREVVSWNMYVWSACIDGEGRPLREVVSWNIRAALSATRRESRPLREVVSWNTKRYPFYSWCFVDLFVRSWVEISNHLYHTSRVLSRPLREVVSWNGIVIILCCVSCGRPLREVVSWNGCGLVVVAAEPLSTSSWGRELKY